MNNPNVENSANNTYAHTHTTNTWTLVEEFNRLSKSVISTTQARSEELLELLIELGMLEHTQTHTCRVHRQTPVQVVRPVFVCQLFMSGVARCCRLNNRWRRVHCFTPCRLSFTSQRASRSAVSAWRWQKHTAQTCLLHQCADEIWQIGAFILMQREVRLIVWSWCVHVVHFVAWSPPHLTEENEKCKEKVINTLTNSCFITKSYNSKL